MQNVDDNRYVERGETKLSSPEKAIITEAIELLNEVKRYRGIFYKQRVAHLEAKAKKLNIV